MPFYLLLLETPHVMGFAQTASGLLWNILSLVPTNYRSVVRLREQQDLILPHMHEEASTELCVRDNRSLSATTSGLAGNNSITCSSKSLAPANYNSMHLREQQDIQNKTTSKLGPTIDIRESVLQLRHVPMNTIMP